MLPADIKALIDGLALRERTLVILAASTGLRQSEIFGLKWGDIDFERGAMNVARSIVYGVVDPCKTESSQKTVPMHPTVSDTLMQWRKRCTYIEPEDWVFASKRYRPKTLLGPGDFAQIYTSCCATRGNSEAIRMAYFPAHVLDPATKRGGLSSR